MDQDIEIVKVWKGGTAQRLPVWLMRQAGRYLPEYRALRAEAGSFLDLCFSPKFSSAVTLQPLQRFDLDAAIVFSDILILPHALGQGLRFAEGEGPILEAISHAGQLREAADIDVLSPVYETLEITRAKLDKTKALIGFAGSPWTVASYMIEGRGGHDFGRIKALMTQKPDDFAAIIEHLVVHTTAHLNAQISAGADAVQLFESWAGALSGDDYRRFVIEPNKRIVAGIRAVHPDVPVIVFPRASGQAGLLAALDTGADALALSQDINPQWAAETLQGKVCLQGQLDPEILLRGGAEMEGAVQTICAALGHGPFVFNLGHGVIKETPPEHIGQLVALVHGWKA